VPVTFRPSGTRDEEERESEGIASQRHVGSEGGEWKEKTWRRERRKVVIFAKRVLATGEIESESALLLLVRAFSV